MPKKSGKHGRGPAGERKTSATTDDRRPVMVGRKQNSRDAARFGSADGPAGPEPVADAAPSLIAGPVPHLPRPNAGILRVEPGQTIDLAAIDAGATGDFDKDAARALLKVERKRIRDLQQRLYAENRRSVLVVFQAIDTGGKDGTIRAVFQGVNPQGCRVRAFKVPSAEELAHDFLWRYHAETPGRGMIGVFNRSHYEDVLAVRVKSLVPEPVWRERFGLINDFERLLTASGTTILKFFLHISRDEQKRRLEARLADPRKHWKFDAADLVERRSWDAYRDAFNDALARCSTPYAPWHVVPANRKWSRNVVIARLIADTLEAMDPRYPEAQQDIAQFHVPD